MCRTLIDHRCQRDDRNCSYDHPNMVDTNIGKFYKADYSTLTGYFQICIISRNIFISIANEIFFRTGWKSNKKNENRDTKNHDDDRNFYLFL